MTMYIGERDMQGSIRALKAAPKLHNYNSTRNKNSGTQKYTYIMHIKKTYTHLKLQNLPKLERRCTSKNTCPNE